MDEENNKLELSQKPGSVLGSTLTWAAIGTAVTAGVFALFSQIPVLRKIWKRGPLDEAISGAALGAVGGGLAGYDGGKREQTVYPLQKENAQLKNKIASLESDKQFTKELIQERIDAVKNPPVSVAK